MKFEVRELPTKEWPRALHEIPEPPRKLYVRGSMPSDAHHYLTVVGSRKYSTYGKEATRTLISGLRGYPISIVSGLALGIDMLAHEAALDAGLHAIAVPGSGINDDVLYPRAHVGLAQRILASGGILLSEFEPHFKTEKGSFAERNRIMAGIARATLVIEAGNKSGTLITARLATEYNRDVLTVPGSIFSSHSFGPHMLIRLGATPITKSEDILEALGIETVATARAPLDLSLVEQEIYDALQAPLSREALAMRVRLPIPVLNMHVTLLELRSVLREVDGTLFREG